MAPALQSVSGVSRQHHEERRELAAVVELVEASRSADFDRSALVCWLDAHIASPEGAPRPTVVTEPGVGRVALRGPDVDHDAAKRVVAAACARATDALRGLLAPRRDDRFVAAAIFAGRVHRAAVDGRRVWIASPSATDSLGDILRALLATDVLNRRELYDATSLSDEGDLNAPA